MPAFNRARQLFLPCLPIAISAAVIFATAKPWLYQAIETAGYGIYWPLRLAVTLKLVIAPALSLLVALALPFQDRPNLAVANLTCFLAILIGHGWLEKMRLLQMMSTYDISWQMALAYVDRFLVVGALTGFILSSATVRLSVVPAGALKRAKLGFFGNADWLDMNTAASILPDTAGIVVGERYRVDQDRVRFIPFVPGERSSWGKGGRSPLLTYRQDFDSTHLLFFAGSGGFKTTSNVVPTALRYDGPLVCLDPSTEVAPMVMQHRRTALKRHSICLDPRDPSCGFNVLDWIATSDTKEEDIITVAHMLLSESARVETSTGSYFQNQSHNLLSGLLGHVILSPDYEGQRTLRSLRQIVSQPEPSVLALIRDVQKTSSSLFVSETLGVFTNMTEQTFSGVYSTASKDTQWLSLPGYADMVCGRSFHSRALSDGDIDIFLNIPTAILRSYPGIGRVIIGTLLSAMMRADGAFKKRALFMLDEVDLLGYMRVLEDARDRGRKYGISMMMMYQSVGQLEKHFGKDGATSWIDGSALVSFAAVKSLETARTVSALCGEMTVEVDSESRTVAAGLTPGRQSRSKSKSFQRRPLIMPHEIIQSMRRDEQIIIVPGNRPLRCGRALYFRRKDMMQQVGKSRFHSSTQR
jgi:type IV secretion system protein VirD4